MCSEFKRHLLHFSWIPYCQSLLPPLMCMLKYHWHEYARKLNAKPAPQIIADPFKVSKPLTRSLMQRLLSKTKIFDCSLCKQQEWASAITLWKQPLVRITNWYNATCLVYFILMKPCFTQHLEFLSCLAHPWHPGRVMKEWATSSPAGVTQQMLQETPQILLISFCGGVSPDWMALQVIYYKSQFTWLPSVCK